MTGPQQPQQWPGYGHQQFGHLPGYPAQPGYPQPYQGYPGYQSGYPPGYAQQPVPGGPQPKKGRKALVLIVVAAVVVVGAGFGVYFGFFSGSSGPSSPAGPTASALGNPSAVDPCSVISRTTYQGQASSRRQHDHAGGDLPVQLLLLLGRDPHQGQRGHRHQLRRPQREGGRRNYGHRGRLARGHADGHLGLHLLHRLDPSGPVRVRVPGRDRVRRRHRPERPRAGHPHCATSRT